MRAEIITIGGEILSGHTLDTNFHVLARFLSGHGIELGRHVTVGDEPEAIRDAMRAAMARAELILTTGGLGGTPDDLTRDVVSGLLGRKLLVRPELLSRFEAAYRGRGLEMPDATRRIACVPEGARLLSNPVGQAPGLWLETAQVTIVLLPGVPAEMRAVLATDLEPLIAARGTGRHSRVFRTVGIGEAALAEALAARGVEGVAFLPGAGQVDIRLTVPAPDPSPEATTRAIAAIREVAGMALFAEEDVSLEAVVGRELLRRGETLALAESLTGGQVGAAITRVPGASAYFVGSAVTYSNDLKRDWLGVSDELLTRFGAVSPETAAAMAGGVRRETASDWGLATTGIAGPGGGTPEKPVGLVCFGLAFPDGEVHTACRRLAGDRSGILERTVVAALDLLRRALAGLPLSRGEK